MQETLATKAAVKAKVSSVEFWRFVFTALVCLYHQEILFMKGKALPSGTSAVEFFFVLGGFLLAMSARSARKRHPEPFTAGEARARALEYVTKKLKVFYPILIPVLLLWLFACYTGGDKLQAAMDLDWDLLMMVGTPFGYRNGAAPIVPLWFLTVLLVVGYAYTYFISRHYEATLFAAPLLGVLGYSYFLLNSSLVLDFMAPMGFLTAGMVRGVTEMSLGVALYCLYDCLSKKKLAVGWRVVLSILEVYAVYRFFALTLHQSTGPDNFRRIIYIMVIILLSFLNVTGLSMVLNNKVSRFLGSFTFAMYICHFPIATLYSGMVAKWKMISAFSGYETSATRFLEDMGGYQGFTPIPISWKDRIVYMAMVVAVSLVLHYFGVLVRRLLEKGGEKAN